MQVNLIAHTPEPEKVVAAAAKLCYSDSHIADLLDGLTEQTQFIKVVQARLRDTSKLKGEEKTQAEKLKRYWKVPDDNAQEERDPHEIEAELLAKIST